KTVRRLRRNSVDWPLRVEDLPHFGKRVWIQTMINAVKTRTPCFKQFARIPQLALGVVSLEKNVPYCLVLRGALKYPQRRLFDEAYILSRLRERQRALQSINEKSHLTVTLRRYPLSRSTALASHVLKEVAAQYLGNIPKM